MNNTPSRLDKYILDPAFNVLETMAVEAIKLPVNLIRKGTKFLVNGIVDLVNPF